MITILLVALATSLAASGAVLLAGVCHAVDTMDREIRYLTAEVYVLRRSQRASP